MTDHSISIVIHCPNYSIPLPSITAMMTSYPAICENMHYDMMRALLKVTMSILVVVNMKMIRMCTYLGNQHSACYNIESE